MSRPEDKVICPNCHSDSTYYDSKEGTYVCDDCGEFFDETDDDDQESW